MFWLITRGYFLYANRSSSTRNRAAKSRKKKGWVKLFMRKIRELIIKRARSIPWFRLLEIKAITENKKRKRSGKNKLITDNL